MPAGDAFSKVDWDKVAAATSATPTEAGSSDTYSEGKSAMAYMQTAAKEGAHAVMGLAKGMEEQTLGGITMEDPTQIPTITGGLARRAGLTSEVYKGAGPMGQQAIRMGLEAGAVAEWVGLGEAASALSFAAEPAG